MFLISRTLKKNGLYSYNTSEIWAAAGLSAVAFWPIFDYLFLGKIGQKSSNKASIPAAKDRTAAKTLCHLSHLFGILSWNRP